MSPFCPALSVKLLLFIAANAILFLPQMKGEAHAQRTGTPARQCRGKPSEICEKHLPDGLKGLYCDGHIRLEKALTQSEKTCVLAEELGHHHVLRHHFQPA